MNALEVHDLVVRFGDVAAVDGISFAVRSGHTLGLLGGNGAGKTTTISTLLGLIEPTAGRVSVLGADMPADRYAVLARVNYSSPYSALPARLSVGQILRFYGHLYGVIGIRRRIRTLTRDLDIVHLMDRPFGQLSAGQTTRVALAKALINRPDLLLLDEPTASLDPDTADWVRALLESYRARTGCSILIASHNMAEVERLCSDVVVLGGGKIIDSGSPGQLLRRYGETDFEAVFLDIVRADADDQVTP
jgi:ABC-2 type transport system ATP-binding protein